MRAGPLADADVITCLNRYYVPVYVSNEDYDKDGPAPAAEKAERNRVWSDALEAGKSEVSIASVFIWACKFQCDRPVCRRLSISGSSGKSRC